MHNKRADKILKGDSNIKVAYKDKMVWIENVDDSSGKATVKVIGSGEIMNVPVNELKNLGPEIK